MFTRYYVEFPIPVPPMVDALWRAPGSILAGLVQDAQARARALLAEVGLSEDAGAIPAVAVEIGDPMRFATMTALPMVWRPAGPSPPFPVVEADLEIAPLGESATQLAISARYTPPALGRSADRAAFHRVVEAMVKDFVDHVGRLLVEGAVV